MLSVKIPLEHTFAPANLDTVEMERSALVIVDKSFALSLLCS